MGKEKIMGTFLNDLKHNYVFSTILTVAVGLVLLIWPDISGKILCYTLGAALILMGSIQLIGFVRGERLGIVNKFSMFMGIILVIFGIFVCANPHIVLSIIPFVVGIVILMHGCMDIAYTMDIKNTGAPKWWIALLAAIITFVFGLILVLHPYLAFGVTMQLLGIALLYDGGSDLILLIVAAYQQRQSDKRVREFAQNAEAGTKDN